MATFPGGPETSLRSFAMTVLRELEHCTRATPSSRPVTADLGSQAELAQQLHSISAKVGDEQRAVTRSPFVAAVTAVECGLVKAILVSRHYTPDADPATPGAEYVSYMAPLGRLAAADPVASLDISTPGGLRSLTVVLGDHFSSSRANGEWDAVDNAIRMAQGLKRRLPSLRRYIAEPEAETGIDDNGGQFDASALPVVAEVTPEATLAPTERTAFALPDIAILDDIQDEFFRMPLDTRLAITGAPGTGKTTTLIKRISQKTKLVRLGLADAEELDRAVRSLLDDPERAWLMVIPAREMASFLRTALAAEHLIGTNRTLQTWTDIRARLVKSFFGIRHLRPDSHPCAAPAALVELRQLVRARQREVLAPASAAISAAKAALDRVQALEGLGAGFPEASRHFGRDLESILTQMTTFGSGTPFQELSRLDAHLQMANSQRDRALGLLGESTDGDRQLFEVYSALYSDVTFGETSVSPVFAGPHLSAARAVAVSQLRLACESLDDEAIGLTNLPPAFKPLITELGWSKVGGTVLLAAVALRLAARLQAALPQPSALLGVIAEVVLQHQRTAHTGAIARVRNLIVSQTALTEAEADIALFLALEDATSAIRLGGRPISWVEEDPSLRVFLAHQRGLVAVDEATDLSWAALSSLSHLAHPHGGGFAVVGDLMQRTTMIGLRHWEELEAVLPDLKMRYLERGYRQSPRLMAEAARLYRDVIGNPPSYAKSIPVVPDGLAPQVVVVRSIPEEAAWLRTRIGEVARLRSTDSTIAVFVPSAAEVGSWVKRLGTAVGPLGYIVEDGTKALGTAQGRRVRVLPITQVKGMEFQAVFLLRCDRLFALNPDLAPQYLYVAITRAVEFFGMTVTRTAAKHPVLRRFIDESNRPRTPIR